jgi:hypothetical protein
VISLCITSCCGLFYAPRPEHTHSPHLGTVATPFLVGPGLVTSTTASTGRTRRTVCVLAAGSGRGPPLESLAGRATCSLVGSCAVGRLEQRRPSARAQGRDRVKPSPLPWQAAAAGSGGKQRQRIRDALVFDGGWSSTAASSSRTEDS